ncbi:MAG: type I restriction-modification system subunit M N-terminal domain-containing protein [Rhodanobacter sp.]
MAWESANILCGPVDAADFKTYIFPLLFFKRICDVWDDEYQEIVDDTGDEQLTCFPESHRFQVPGDCQWNDMCSPKLATSGQRFNGPCARSKRTIRRPSMGCSAMRSGRTRIACPMRC